jgi:hypothetical protein
MKSGICVRAAALAAAVSLWASPAMGQITSLSQLSEAQDSEIYCVHDVLRDADESFYVVVEAFLFDDKNGEDAAAALDKATDACAAEYKWDAGKQDIGTVTGLASAIVDYLVEELYAEGAKDEHLDAIDRVAMKLSKEDINRFTDDSWLDDAVFIKRIDTMLIAEKFPADDDYNLETARFIIEAHVGQSLAAWEWVRVYINKQ